MTEKYKGRFAQIGICFGKFLRMFVYQNDWKVLPMGALIAALVTFVIGSKMFVTQEGTTTGTFALTCVCIWNGLFNSIQVVCRERAIIKREHRAGLHISSYIVAHMIYQLILCVLQTLVTLLICGIAGIQLFGAGTVTPWALLDLGITILLITYSADIMALMVSCIVKTTTTAMTVMPFLLIFELVFSGLFKLGGAAKMIMAATISHWGMDSLCAIGHFNDLPMTTLWNTLAKLKDLTVLGEKPILNIMQYIEANGYRDEFLLWSGSYGAKDAYASIASNVLSCWGVLILLTIICAVAAVIALKFIDLDKR